MTFLSAQVFVEVDDSKLSSQLSKAKSAVTQTVDKIKNAFSKMATSFRQAFDTMVRYAKWGALAITGALALAARAAMKQEDAMFGLAAALKVAGEYSGSTMKRLIAFASEMQQVTTYGDEMILGQMAYARALGISANQMEAVMKAAIGLSVITGNLETSTMLVARASLGQTAMLTRYGIILDESLSPQEKFNALLKRGSELFELAKAQAETTSGSLKQMKNAVGDVAEVIGMPLLPVVKSAAKAIKEWAQTNQERIGYWARIIAAYMNYSKNVFIDFIGFMKKDFGEAWGLIWDVLVETMKLALKEIVTLSIAAGKGIWEGIKAGLLPKVTDTNAILREYEKLGGKLGVKGGKGVSIPVPPIKGPMISLAPAVKITTVEKELWEQAKIATEQEAISKRTESLIAGLGETMTQHVQTYTSKVKELFAQSGVDITESQRKLQTDLAAIEAEYHPTLWQQIKKAAQDYYNNLKGWISDSINWLQAQANAQKEIIKPVEDVDAAYRSMRGQMGKMSKAVYDSELKIIEDLKAQYEVSKMDQLSIDQWYYEQKRLLDLELLKSSNSIISGFEAAGMQMKYELKSFGEISYDVAMKMRDAMADAFADMIMNAKNFKEAATGFLKAVANYMVQIVAMQAATSLMGGLGLMPAAMTKAPAAQTGGFVEQGGLAKIHTGETIQPAGRSNAPEVTINLINQTGRPLEATETKTHFANIKELVVDVIVDDITRYGKSRQAIGSMFERG